ncbi:M16 family metallopeptidase [Paracoccaceae bacterium GXU_MW_L88]
MIRPIVAGLLALSAAPVFAETGDVTDFTLENGMEVVVIEDHRAPVVTHMVWYRTGAADEAEGESGLAHFFEHLMFKGTEAVPEGEFSTLISENGGEHNAFTSSDYTAYYQRIAADRLPLVMELEADRMENLDISEEAVRTERDVVLEERNQRVDSDPAARFNEQRTAITWLNHPYRKPIIGWRHELAALERDQALAFYGKYYAPNNAILVVAGDVTPDEVRVLAEEHYGPLEASDAITERVRPAEPPQIAARRVEFTDARVGQPYVVRSYIAPERDAGDQEDAAALVILADLLGSGGVTSVLGQALQVEQGIALSAGAYYDGVSLDDAQFGVYVVPAATVSLEDAEAAMDAALADFLENGIDSAQFARVKTQIAAAEIYARDSQFGLARRYGAALTSGLTIEDVQAWPEVLAAVTEEDVMAAAEALFDPARSVTGWLMRPEAPAPDAETPDVPSPGGAAPAGDAEAVAPATPEGEQMPEEKQ